MTGGDWVRGKGLWLARPGLLTNVAVTSLACLHVALGLTWKAEGWATVAAILLTAATFTCSLIAWATTRGTALFRDLAAERTAPTGEHRLAAIVELRRFPKDFAVGCMIAWVCGALVASVLLFVVQGIGWPTVFRLLWSVLLFAIPNALIVFLVSTRRVHAATDAISEGLDTNTLFVAGEARIWPLQRRMVLITAALALVPIAILAEIFWQTTGGLSQSLVGLTGQEREVLLTGHANRFLVRLLVLVAGAIALSLAAAWAAGTVVAQPLRRLAVEARKIARGEVGRIGVISGDGEVGEVTGVFGTMHQRMGDLVAQLNRTGHALKRTTATLTAATRQYEETAASQAAGLNETAATTEELAHSARQISERAGSAQDLVKDTLAAAELGQADAKAFQAAVDRMKQDNHAVAAAVLRLQGRVQQIGRIVELINTVAERSDLLALSAELEGTRAGEAGRGFALVGSEMRRLAENVLESTAEVEGLISEIREATDRTSQATQRGYALTEGSTSQASGVSSSLEAVVKLAAQSSDKVRSISLATQQQQTGTDQLAETMVAILEVTQRGLDASKQLSAANQSLTALSSTVTSALERFEPSSSKGSR